MQAYWGRTLTDKGKRPLVFNPREAYNDLRVEVPCGQCIGCRLEYARQWAVRAVHELKCHKRSCFLTLTYSDKNLPQDGLLEKKELQKFQKRLAKYIAPIRVRYMSCGEYGEETNRPHYHIILYGYDFPDKEKYSENQGYPIYTSKILDRLWEYGECKIGSVTFESCCYVARYMLKKQKGKNKRTDGGEEFLFSSRQPGLGEMHYQKYKGEIYETDSVIVRGKEMRPPKYYDSKFEEYAEKEMAEIKKGRRKNTKIESIERMLVKEKVQHLKQKRIKRK